MLQNAFRQLMRLPALWRDRILIAPQVEEEVITAFHKLYYNQWNHLNRDTLNASWQGVRTLKCPMDLWVYQELIAELQPDLIVETGTYSGGSALFLSQMLDLIGGEGRVLSVDLRDPDNWPSHPRLNYLTGSSTAPDILASVQEAASQAQQIMVILDSDHREAHVSEELRQYAKFVTLGSYLIVEDTNVNGHPVVPDHGPGPMEAVQAFLKTNPAFEIDRARERFLLTMNPGGYLRRVR